MSVYRVKLDCGNIEAKTIRDATLKALECLAQGDFNIEDFETTTVAQEIGVDELNDFLSFFSSNDVKFNNLNKAVQERLNGQVKAL